MGKLHWAREACPASVASLFPPSSPSAATMTTGREEKRRDSWEPGRRSNMADDLEELLDEVESKFCRLPRQGLSERGQDHLSRKRNARDNGDRDEMARGSVAPSGERARFSKALPRSEEEDIDEIIKEIIDENSYAKSIVKQKSETSSPVCETNTSVQPQVKRCCPVYLGGSGASCGIGRSSSQRTCDQLRCTACDFRVSHYNDYQWDKSCDYLFFRNNMPEFQKLRTKMLVKKGSRAYACQCTWRSIEKLTDLSMDRQLRWVCSKHTE